MKIRIVISIIISFLLIITPLSVDSVAVSSELIGVKEDSVLFIDRSAGCISGFLPGTKYADIVDEFIVDVDFYDTDGNLCDLQDNVSTNDAAITTDGSDALIILVYGDVNSDGLVDGTDALLIEMLLSNQLYESDLDHSNYLAAVYADRLDGLSEWDVQACFDSGLMTDSIPQNPQSATSEDKSELLQIFNDTMNSVKAERPGVKTVKNSLIPSVVGEGYVSQQIADSIKGKEASSEEEYKKGKSHDDAIPIAKKTWTSALTLEDIKDISATDNGDGSFTITVEMPDESYDALTTKASATKHGKIIDACEFVPESGQENWYTSVIATYSGVTIKCRYNSFTGDFISADYNIPYQVKMLGKLSMIVVTYPIDVTVEYLQTISVTRT